MFYEYSIKRLNTKSNFSVRMDKKNDVFAVFHFVTVVVAKRAEVGIRTSGCCSIVLSFYAKPVSV